MTDRFNFSDRELSLILEDHTFTVSIDDETLKLCSEIRQDTKAYISGLTAKDSVTDATVTEICAFMEACIDRLLGCGSAKTVFGSRPMKLLDLTELLCFILARVSRAVSCRITPHTEE